MNIQQTAVVAELRSATTPPPYRITCSCGRTTTIRWTGRRYETTTAGWTCSYPSGWHCAGTEHRQRVGAWLRPAPTTPTAITL